MTPPPPTARPARFPLACLLTAACLLLAGCESALFAGFNSADEHHGVAPQRDIVFEPEHRLALDVYAPRHAEHAPVVVFFYGGSWVRGERAWYRFVGTALAAHGVVAVIPDYRKYPKVKMDGFMRDAARAVAWAHDHAGDYGGDAGDLFVMGHSAGGQIAALLATDPQWLAPYRLRPRDLAGFVGLAGCYDFMPIPAREHDMLGMFGRTPAEQERAQPVRFVRGAEPPMLLLQGTADHEVEPSNARSLARAMRGRREDVTLKLYPHVGHLSLLFAVARPLRRRVPTLADSLTFIRAHPHAGAAPALPDGPARNARAAAPGRLAATRPPASSRQAAREHAG
ncbi:alpha/beta hydrolase [Frateuria defendens]|uniref:alpha/beta hydrolase n=1 Tax=Frateuria defendens TaxID=2219559 RepID=UPI0007DBEF91|nr:alpha/beta hydrolase [Frateuria defendens]